MGFCGQPSRQGANLLPRSECSSAGTSPAGATGAGCFIGNSSVAPMACCSQRHSFLALAKIGQGWHAQLPFRFTSSTAGQWFKPCNSDSVACLMKASQSAASQHKCAKRDTLVSSGILRVGIVGPMLGQRKDASVVSGSPAAQLLTSGGN